MFDSIPSVCEEVNNVANAVFTNPAAVMGTFIVVLFTGRIKVRSFGFYCSASRMLSQHFLLLLLL